MLPEKKRGLIWDCIFSLKIRVFSKTKRSSLPFALSFSYFRPKIRVFSKKKKRSSLPFALSFFYFRPKIRVFSKKKKRSLLRIDLLFPYFSHKSLKKESSLRIELRFIYFRRQLQVSSQNANFFCDPIWGRDSQFEKPWSTLFISNAQDCLLKSRIVKRLRKSNQYEFFRNPNVIFYVSQAVSD